MARRSGTQELDEPFEERTIARVIETEIDCGEFAAPAAVTVMTPW